MISNSLARKTLVAVAFAASSLAVFAQQTSAITFSIENAAYRQSWPISVGSITIEGRPIHLDQPVQVQDGWERTATITLRNISPKPIVSGGIVLVFPEPGDGTEAHPRAACWPVQQGQVPKLVWLGRDGTYHLPPGWERQTPLRFAPGTEMRLTFTSCGTDTDATLASGRIHHAVLTFETFYFADGSRWSADQYALPPLPGTRQWRMVSKEEFFASAKAAQ